MVVIVNQITIYIYKGHTNYIYSTLEIACNLMQINNKYIKMQLATIYIQHMWRQFVF